MKPFEATAVFKRITLQRLDFWAQACVTYGAIARATKVDSFLLPNADALVLRLCTSMAGETVPEVDVTFPVTWWDAFKDRWFPKWTRRWLPVTYRHVKVDKHTLFPSIQIPDHSPVVTLTAYDHERTDRNEKDE